MRNIDSVVELKSWQGHRCFILGGGPSLTNFDFKQIENENTIGINKSFLHFPVDMNYVMDEKFYKYLSIIDPTDYKRCKHQEMWKNFKGIKLFLSVAVPNRNDNVFIVNKLLSDTISLNTQRGICPGNNSGFGALAVAIALGCNPIGLLGYSMKIDKENKKTHYHEGYMNEELSSFQRKLDSFRRCFDLHASAIEKVGVNVVNLDLDSALTCFPKETLASFLSRTRGVPISQAV